MNISRKRILFIILIIATLALFILFFSLFSKSERQEILNNTTNLFPFGEIQTTNTETNTNSQETQDDIRGEEFVETDETRVPEKKLRQVSNFPTGGFTTFSRIEEQIVTSNEIDENGILVKQEQIIETENDYVRYSSIAESNIYESRISPYSIRSELLIENFIPNTEKAVFSENGEHVVFQYWDKAKASVESYLGNIKKIEPNIRICPFEFTEKVELGSEGDYVSDLHRFLNRNPRTTIAQSGINSPGNEGSKALESTIIAIKNFQSLNELEIDGVTGPATRAKMKEVCDEQQVLIAQKEFNEQDKKFTLTGRFLPENIVSATINPESDYLFFLQNTGTGTNGVVQNLTTEARETIFSSPLLEIYSFWNSPEAIEITTKPSYLAPTYSYSMDASSGDYHKSLNQENGMTILPNKTNTRAFVSKIKNNEIVTSIYTYETNNEIDLDMSTFADKCVWSYNNIDLYCGVPDSLDFAERYPDSWYQGLELYNDSIYKINTETGEKTLISNIIIEYNESIDISSIKIDRKDEYLYFTDKGTEFLWSYRLFDL